MQWGFVEMSGSMPICGWGFCTDANWVGWVFRDARTTVITTLHWYDGVIRKLHDGNRKTIAVILKSPIQGWFFFVPGLGKKENSTECFLSIARISHRIRFIEVRSEWKAEQIDMLLVTKQPDSLNDVVTLILIRLNYRKEWRVSRIASFEYEWLEDC